MKIDQTAFYCRSPDAATTLKAKLGFVDAWITDRVTALSWVHGMPEGDRTENIALLQFNYQYGTEFEIIRYLSGRHWHEKCNPCWQSLHHDIFVSHIGVHLDDGEDFPSPPGELVQETWTREHTSGYLTTGAAAGRKYHYRIHELSPGSYIKYIKRIHPQPTVEAA